MVLITLAKCTGCIDMYKCSYSSYIYRTIPLIFSYSYVFTSLSIKTNGSKLHGLVNYN